MPTKKVGKDYLRTHLAYRSKCYLCRGVRNALREQRRLSFGQEVHFGANRKFFEENDHLFLPDSLAADSTEDNLLSGRTREKVFYVGDLSFTESESLIEVLGNDVAEVACLSSAPEILKIGLYRLWDKSSAASDMLRHNVLEDALHILGEEYSWIKRRDTEYPGEEDGDDSSGYDTEQEEEATGRTQVFLRTLDISIENFIFAFHETYEIGDAEWCGRTPVIWLQPRELSCCTFVTGCGRNP